MFHYFHHPFWGVYHPYFWKHHHLPPWRVLDSVLSHPAPVKESRRCHTKKSYYGSVYAYIHIMIWWVLPKHCNSESWKLTKGPYKKIVMIIFLPKHLRQCETRNGEMMILFPLWTRVDQQDFDEPWIHMTICLRGDTAWTIAFLVCFFGMCVSKSCSGYDIKRLCVYIYTYIDIILYKWLSKPEFKKKKKNCLSWFNHCNLQHALIEFSSRARSFHLFFCAPCIYHRQPAFPFFF